MCKDLKGFHLYSKNKKILEEFEVLIKRKFGVSGYYRKKTGGYGECMIFQVFNTNICKLLHLVGTPRGDKIKVNFRVPKWIMNNRELSRNYLKIAYYCEGSFREFNRPNPRISFNINKSEKILENGIYFLEDLKEILRSFGIETTPIGVREGNFRKDEITTKLLRFRVITKYNNRFINKIGWMK